MDEEHSYTGNWWLPSNPSFRLPGKLTFTRRLGLKLELHGNFGKPAEVDPRGVMILGEDSFGEAITLYQALFSEGITPGIDPSRGTSSFVANKAFVGCHFANREEATFSAVAYRPTHLDEWLRLPSIDIDWKLPRFSATYNPPSRLEFPAGPGLTIAVAFSSTGPGLSKSLNILSFEQHAWFVLRKDQPAHWNSFGEDLSHLNNLASLAVMAPIHPLEVEAFLPRENNAPLTDPTTRVKVLLPLYRDPTEEDRRFFDMLFTYNHVADRLGTLLQNWFSKRDTLEPVFDLFFAATYNPYSSPVQTFLNYVQALETYHIRTRPNDIDPPDIHKNRLKAILHAAPAEFRQWLGEKLAFSNSPTLAQRLKDLVDANPQLVTGMAGSHEHFINRVKNSRHYYTHYNPSRKEEAESGGRLRGLSMVLGSMLEAFLLIEAGFELAETRELQRNRRSLPQAWL